MGLTKQWATSRGYDYQFLGDEILETVPSWYRQRAGPWMAVNTDLARIQRARLLLNSGYERAVWIDADVLIFDPQNFSIDNDRLYTLCKELWLRPSAKGIACRRQINNCVSIYKQGNPFMDFYEHACRRLMRNPKVGLGHGTVGTVFLTKLNAAMPLPVLPNVANFSPHLVADIANGKGPYLKLHRQLFGSPIQAANLCFSKVDQPIPDHRLSNGTSLDEMTANKAIERLLQTKGTIISMPPNTGEP